MFWIPFMYQSRAWGPAHAPAQLAVDGAGGGIEASARRVPRRDFALKITGGLMRKVIGKQMSAEP